MSKITELNELATEMVADGKTPNVFFVSEAGNIKLVTTVFQEAYSCWQSTFRGLESALEDRLYGCICTNEPEEDGSKKLVWQDDAGGFLKLYPEAE